MANKKIDNVEILLSKLDKRQLGDFIRKECINDGQLQDRFLALGAGTLFKPNPDSYTSRIEDLIEDYAGRHGYIEYRATFDFNRAVTRILDEADKAMKNRQWDVAVAVLTGIAAAGDDILNSGDDSAGELGAIVSECIEKWHELCASESLPENIKDEIFELALTRFNEKNLKGWDWWWDWIEMSIQLADTSDKQKRIVETLDAIKTDGDEWSARHDAQTAQKYKLEIMSKQGTPKEQRKFMYDNVGNPDFRKKLLQMAWDEANYDEVLRLAKEGVTHDTEWAGLVSEWHKWEYQVYCHIGDKDNTLRLARHFFFNGGRWGDREFMVENMYLKIKTLVPLNQWSDYAETLISESVSKRDDGRLLFIYTQEKMWERFMEYLRKNPSAYNIDDSPQEVKDLYRNEIIQLYSTSVRKFFQHASDRNSYREGVGLLRNLIKYGGRLEADKIIIEQKSRTPRRPALIDELSKL
ncbi:MAG: hypothetical protein J6B92_01235 [Paraprevotella sp.]|nr:hypothetical protein [Paraprevotella sp.]